MSTLKKLQHFLEIDNIADEIDEDDLRKYASKIQRGYEVDLSSMVDWMDMNKDAYDLVNNSDEVIREATDESRCKVVYPVLLNAIINLSSRLTPHLLRNGKTVELSVTGLDPDGSKTDQAQRVETHMNYQLLYESDSWLADTHKLMAILCSCGTAHRKVYYDPLRMRNVSEVYSYEDVIINHKIKSLESARRVTIINYMYLNEIIERINSGQFRDVDVKLLKVGDQADGEDDNPPHRVLEQVCYLDLDDDDYEEPYIVFMHEASQEILGIYPAYTNGDIQWDHRRNRLLGITYRPYIVDYHLIDSPDGGYWSLGLNHILYHSNKTINSVLRQLIDAGSLANQQGGFKTRGFKTKEDSLYFELGEFKSVDIPPGTRLSDHIMPLPFSGPSQVLSSLLEVLMGATKEMAFINDLLAGETPSQNVPATTILAVIEQGTRAFKPMVQALQIALKKEFKIYFHLNSLHVDENAYMQLNGIRQPIAKSDYDEKLFNIMPVADPTASSEAHKYAQAQALMQTMPYAANPQAILEYYYKVLQIPNAQQFLQPNPNTPPKQDPKVLDNQTKQMAIQQKAQATQGDQQLQAQELQIKQRLAQAAEAKVMIQQQEAQAKIFKTQADVQQGAVMAQNQSRQVDAEFQKNAIEHQRVQKMGGQSGNPGSTATS